MKQYLEKVCKSLWNYADTTFPNKASVFETTDKPRNQRPPVFLSGHSNLNVITDKNNPDGSRVSFLTGIKLHKHFASMKSSQALAISLFRNLETSGHLHYLEDVTNEQGEHPFEGIGNDKPTLELEYDIGNKLNEPHPTSIDALIRGSKTIYIECKFTENDIGTCTMPKKEKCNGDYIPTVDGGSNCYLSKKKILYWEMIPKYFNISNLQLSKPCPLIPIYQLVRNVLAARVPDNSEASVKESSVVLLYDDRNPSFSDKGAGITAFNTCKDALKEQTWLQSATWQQVTKCLATKSETKWLADALSNKYGF